MATKRKTKTKAKSKPKKKAKSVKARRKTAAKAGKVRKLVKRIKKALLTDGGIGGGGFAG